MNINSINHSSSAAMASGNRALHKPDSARMAEEIFSKLDTESRGYLEPSDLQGAIGKVSGSDSTSGASSSTDAEQMFAKLDSDGDGKVTQAEMSASLEQLAAELDGPFPRMRMQGDRPPPPEDGGQEDQGLTLEQLSAMSEELSATDSAGSRLMSDIAGNFVAADANSDGKVTASEARTYQESKNSATNASDDGGSDSSSTGSTADARFMKQMMALLQAYGANDASETNRLSASV